MNSSTLACLQRAAHTLSLYVPCDLAIQRCYLSLTLSSSSRRIREVMAHTRTGLEERCIPLRARARRRPESGSNLQLKVCRNATSYLPEGTISGMSLRSQLATYFPKILLLFVSPYNSTYSTWKYAPSTKIWPSLPSHSDCNAARLRASYVS